MSDPTHKKYLEGRNGAAEDWNTEGRKTGNGKQKKKKGRGAREHKRRSLRAEDEQLVVSKTKQ